VTPRRALFDPLQTLDSREIPAGSGLKRAFVGALLEWLDAGWQLG
jgi:hypothetical protein